MAAAALTRLSTSPLLLGAQRQPSAQVRHRPGTGQGRGIALGHFQQDPLEGAGHAEPPHLHTVWTRDVRTPTALTEASLLQAGKLP